MVWYGFVLVVSEYEFVSGEEGLHVGVGKVMARGWASTRRGWPRAPWQGSARDSREEKGRLEESRSFGRVWFTTSMAAPPQASLSLLIDNSKRNLLTPNNGLKALRRRLQHKFKCAQHKDPIQQDTLQHQNILLIPAPREKFTQQEFDHIKTFIKSNGSLVLAAHEGGEQQLETNINYLIEEFGIEVRNDSVVRTSYYKYPHPKQVCVQDGVLNSGIERSMGKQASMDGSSSAVSFVYPYGASLNVQKPAFPVLSSGALALPFNRPLCAMWDGVAQGLGGRICVLGSSQMLHDEWLDKEDNASVIDLIFSWVSGADTVAMDTIDANDPDVTEYQVVPDTASLSDRLRGCLQEGDDVSRDFTSLFDHSLFKLDTSHISETIKLYDRLNVAHEPLSLIQPQFEQPLPPMLPSVFPPSLREPPPPALDLFDLDEQFASEKVRLAHLTNKCGDDDLEYYIREAGDVLGVKHQIKPEYRNSARHVLSYIFKQIVAWKKLNSEESSMDAFRRLNHM